VKERATTRSSRQQPEEVSGEGSPKRAKLPSTLKSEESAFVSPTRRLESGSFSRLSFLRGGRKRSGESPRLETRSRSRSEPWFLLPEPGAGIGDFDVFRRRERERNLMIAAGRFFVLLFSFPLFSFIDCTAQKKDRTRCSLAPLSLPPPLAACPRAAAWRLRSAPTLALEKRSEREKARASERAFFLPLRSTFSHSLASSSPRPSSARLSSAPKCRPGGTLSSHQSRRSKGSPDETGDKERGAA